MNLKEKPAHSSTSPSLDAQETRRNFLTTFGKLAVVTPVALTTLMSPTTSAAPKSCRGQGTKRCN
jgi:hypothetical protein